MKRLFILGSIAAWACLSFGCAGYKLGSVKPSSLADINSIAVPTFLNDTLEPRISVMLTNQVIKQMTSDGTYKIGSLETADAVLRARITTIERKQARSTRVDVLRTRELEVVLTIEFVLEHAETGAQLVKGLARGRTDVFLDPNFQLSERQAVQDAGKEAARRLVSSIAEGF